MGSTRRSRNALSSPNSLHSCFDLYCSKYSILEQRHRAFGHPCHCSSLASRAKRSVSPGPQEPWAGSKKQLSSQRFTLVLIIIIPFPSPKPTDQSLRLSEMVLIACVSQLCLPVMYQAIITPDNEKKILTHPKCHSSSLQGEEHNFVLVCESYSNEV